MAYTSVQKAAQATGSGTSSVVAFTNPVTSGNIVCGCFIQTANAVNQISSIVDDQSNTYTIINYSPTTSGFGLFWSGKRLTNGPKTITINYSSSQGFAWSRIDEFGGVPAGVLSLDGNAVATSSTSSPPVTGTSGNFATTIDGDLVYCAIESNGTPTVGSGFALTSNANVSGEFLTQSTHSATTSGTWTIGASGTYYIGAAAISAVASGFAFSDTFSDSEIYAQLVQAIGY